MQDACQLAICPSLTIPARKKQIPNRKANQRIMELPLHARLDFVSLVRFGKGQTGVCLLLC